MLFALTSALLPLTITAPQVRMMSGTVSVRYERNERVTLPRDSRLIIQVHTGSGTIFGWGNQSSSSSQSSANWNRDASAVALYSVRAPRTLPFNYSFSIPDATETTRQTLYVVARIESDDRILYQTVGRTRINRLDDVDLELRRYTGRTPWNRDDRDDRDDRPGYDDRFPRELVGEWRLIEMDGRDIYGTSTAPSLTFRTDGSLSGYTGINRFSADGRVSGSDGLRIDPGAMTRIGGSDAAMRLERDFVDNLSAVTRYRIGYDTLDLYRGNSVLMRLRRR